MRHPVEILSRFFDRLKARGETDVSCDQRPLAEKLRGSMIRVIMPPEYHTVYTCVHVYMAAYIICMFSRSLARGRYSAAALTVPDLLNTLFLPCHYLHSVECYRSTLDDIFPISRYYFRIYRTQSCRSTLSALYIPFIGEISRKSGAATVI